MTTFNNPRESEKPTLLKIDYRDYPEFMFAMIVVYMRGKYQAWYRDGKVHREGDLPAVIEGDICEWYKNGVLHREGDNPAVIVVDDDGDDYKLWYKNGVLHRDGDNPAYVQADCLREWYKDGLLHREAGPGVVNRSRQEWNKNGIRME